MPPVVRHTLSLRPQGFYGYAFLIARVAQIVCLAVVMGLASHFVSVTSRARDEPPGTLIVIILFTSAALLWTLFSSTGYSRRYLPYPVTLAVDLLFLVPFIVIAIILGLPLGDADCAAVPPTGKFEIAAPPGSSFGKIAFPRDGRSECSRMFTAWGLLIALCVLFAASALAVGFLHMGEKQLNSAIFAPKEELPVGSRDEWSSSQRMTERTAAAWGPPPVSAAQPGVSWGAGFGSHRAGASGFNNAVPHPRSSVAEDGLKINRPVTLVPANSQGSPGFRYEEPLGQPAPARMPRMQPVDGFGLPSNPRRI